jgi:hypothetical protein
MSNFSISSFHKWLGNVLSFYLQHLGVPFSAGVLDGGGNGHPGGPDPGPTRNAGGSGSSQHGSDRNSGSSSSNSGGASGSGSGSSSSSHSSSAGLSSSSSNSGSHSNPPPQSAPAHQFPHRIQTQVDLGRQNERFTPARKSISASGSHPTYSTHFCSAPDLYCSACRAKTASSKNRPIPIYASLTARTQINLSTFAFPPEKALIQSFSLFTAATGARSTISLTPDIFATR